MWRLHVVSFVFLLQGLASILLQNNASREDNKTEQKDKKGTIRIAGPWHSDSALDRNIDPGEDSYVKKIISTNEGINFNKDMAEAGEMFDVNGIDDFYDKNAMITYEVNGHEVPVHLKPKYTPQSKSMFPEYIRETPAAMGLARHANPLAMQKLPKHKLTLQAISGFTSKDLPEYNVHDSPTLHTTSKEEELKHLAAQNFFHHLSPQGRILQTDTKLPWKSATSSATSQLKGDDSTSSRISETSGKFRPSTFDSHGEREVDAASLKKIEEAKLLRTIELAKLRFQKLHESDIVDQRTSDENTKKYKQKIQDGSEDVSEQPKLHHLMFHHSSYKNDDERDEMKPKYTSEDGRFVKASEKEKEMLQHSLNEHLNDHESKPEVSEFIDRQQKQSESATLFSKLEDLHKKFKGEKENVENDEEHKTVVDGPEKVKAKTRILSLLGELSSKLKGMEAVVANGHKVEKYHDEPQEKTEDVKEVEKDASTKNYQSLSTMRENEHNEETEQMMTSEQEKIIQQKLRAENQDESDNLKSRETSSKDERSERGDEYNTDHRPARLDEEARETSKNNHESGDIPERSEQVEEKASETANKIRLDEENAIESSTAAKFHPSSQEEEEREEEHHNSIVPDIIESFRDEKKPFIMDTSAIDFKPVFPTLNIDDRHGDQEDETESHQQKHKYTKTKSHKKSRSEDQNDVDNDDETVTSSKHRHHKNKLKHQKKHKHTKTFESSSNHDDDDEEETDDGSSKHTEEIAESLASADENNNNNNGIARERTYHSNHFPIDDIEYPDYNDVKDAAIFETNLLRKRYHANKLSWSDRLSDRAQQLAEKLAHRTDFNPEKLEQFKSPGESIAFVKLNSPNVGKEAVDTWEKESKNYDFRSPQVTIKNNDFVQLMWQKDKEFGMGVAKSKHKKGWIVTSVYDTGYVDQFKDLKVNLKSEVPIDDPYSDITG